MLNNLTKPDILPISRLLAEDQYIIPLYQRAYAWTKTEIDQLLTDMLEKSAERPVKEYYIGSLIIASGASSYEIVDGQQRFTTLTLINIVINHLFESPSYACGEINLNFEGRQASSAILQEFSRGFEAAISVAERPEKVHSLIDGINDILRFFRSILKEKPRQEVENFAAYIYKHVMIIRIPLPQGTNFNRYFEIMNNRGAQLEPHEILKARLLETLKNKSEHTRKAFAAAWDACAQMDRYIQSAFSSQSRIAVFGEDLSSIPSRYLQANPAEQPAILTDSSDTLASILKNPSRYQTTGKTDLTEPRFRSVINFPNFLLHMLTLHLSDHTISLDEKKLLSEFGCGLHAKRKMPDAIDFLNDLVYYRTCFDRYVIKREEAAAGSGWKILRLRPDGSYVNVFEYPEALIMVQSMLHVSFASNNFKNWLQKALSLFRDAPVKEEKQFRSDLENISQATFASLTKHMASGTGTQTFLFNYLDLRLWEIYRTMDDPSAANSWVSKAVLNQISRNRQIFKNFRFRQNNSVEHVAPRRPDTDLHHVQNLDNFGNLCLISRSSNSKYSNANFDSKKDYYLADVEKNRVESLKQVLIFQHSRWKDQDILIHGAEMASILFKEKIMHSLEDLVQLITNDYPMVLEERQLTNMTTHTIERLPQPKYLYRGERTIDWPTSPTTFTRNLLGKNIFEDVNYLLTGSALKYDFTYQHHSLFQFLREDLYGIGAINPPDYPAQIDADLAGIFQHYGFDTCLLDLTSEIRIAASFAAMGKPGDIGQIMILETSKIEDRYFDLQQQPGNRAAAQRGYGLLGTRALDVKSKEFSDLYQPLWLKFILTENDRIKYANNLMLDVSNDRVADAIKSWWEHVGSRDQRASDEAKNYIGNKIAQLK